MTKRSINVIEGGIAAGPVVVLIHGFMSSRHQWDLNLAALGARFRTVLLELPGHGDSPAQPEAAAFSPESLLPAIDEVRRALDIEQWWVVGHSLGGAVGIRYALAYPDRTLGVVFTNSRAVFGIHRDPAAPSREPRQPRSTEDLRRLPFHPIHAKRFPEALKERMVQAADCMAPATIGQLTVHAPRWRSRDELGQLAVPVLLVNGRWERAFQPHVAEAQAVIPDLQVIELEGGHSINIEQSDAFDAAVIDFIASRG